MAVAAFPGFSEEPRGCSHVHAHARMHTHICTHPHTRVCTHPAGQPSPAELPALPAAVTGAPPLDNVIGRDAPGKNRRASLRTCTCWQARPSSAPRATNLVPSDSSLARGFLPQLCQIARPFSAGFPAPQSREGPLPAPRPCLSLGLLRGCAPCSSGGTVPLVKYSPGTNSACGPGFSGHRRGHRVAHSKSQCFQALPSSLGSGLPPT